MSRIEFESKSGSANVPGAERYHADHFFNKLTMLCLGPSWNRPLLLKGIPARDGLHDKNMNDHIWASRFEAALFYGNLDLSVNSETFDSFHLALNTATALGSDAMKLMARIHGQCELNAYIEAENRNWVADIIETAPVEIFRPDAGWEEVVSFLRENDAEPVVLSYTVTDSALGAAGRRWVEQEMNANEPTEKTEERWNAITADEQWDYCMSVLRDTSGLEISPTQLAIAHGFSEVTAGDLLEKLRAA